MKQDTTFHFLIAEATGNEVLLQIVDSLMDLLQKTREASLKQPERRLVSLKNHKAILEAIQSRRPVAAGRCMRRHIEQAEETAFT